MSYNVLNYNKRKHIITNSHHHLKVTETSMNQGQRKRRWVLCRFGVGVALNPGFSHLPWGVPSSVCRGARLEDWGPWSLSLERCSLSGLMRAASGQMVLRWGQAWILPSGLGSGLIPPLPCYVSPSPHWQMTILSLSLSSCCGKSRVLAENRHGEDCRSFDQPGHTYGPPPWSPGAFLSKPFSPGEGPGGLWVHRAAPGAGNQSTSLPGRAGGFLQLTGATTYSPYYAQHLTQMPIKLIPAQLPTALRMKSASPPSHLSLPHSAPCQPHCCHRAFAHAAASVRMLFPQGSAHLPLHQDQLRTHLPGEHLLTSLTEMTPSAH